MILRILVLAAALCVLAGNAAKVAKAPVQPNIVVKPAATKTNPDLGDSIDTLRKAVSSLAWQLSQQQVFVEEKIRSEGSSGIKQVRASTRQGTRPYYTETYSGYGAFSAHDHSNYDRTIGMGELSVVLNGVEFRTRHNDYKLVMPSKSSKSLNEVEPVPFPDVPSAVSSKKTVQEQVAEMKLWFKAWRDQDYSERDFRKYFKPVLCYLEGYWTEATEALREPFSSDRHRVDAANWKDLQDKLRFSAYTGRKSDSENYAFLPTMVTGVDEDTGMPTYAQWNYRIVCHPLRKDVPLNRLRVVDDLSPRLSFGKDLDSYGNTRSARFEVNIDDTSVFKDKSYNKKSLLEELMSEIPGKDNYPASVVDNTFNSTAFEMDADFFAKGPKPIPLNAGYYHRYYKTSGRDAMGEAVRRLGFSDQNLFVAATTQPDVISMSVRHKFKTYVPGKKAQVEYRTYDQRVSYAIPLELIYLNPLSKWNPYNLEQKGVQYTSLGRSVVFGGRNGGKTVEKAYNGTRDNLYYLTPSSFFSGEEVKAGKADTTRGSVGVLDKKGNLRMTSASGTRILLPNIEGVGVLRQRYPIAPVYQDGDTIWKELQALKDIVLQGRKFSSYYINPLAGNINTTNPDEMFTYVMQESTKSPPGPHSHTVILTGEQIEQIKQRKAVTITTSEDYGHTHELKLAVNPTNGRIYYSRCDGQQLCWDGHKRPLECLDCHDGHLYF